MTITAIHLAAVLMLTLSSSATAQNEDTELLSGNTLYDDLTDGSVQAALGLGYVLGVAGSMAFQGVHMHHACFPAGVVSEQIKDVVEQSLRNHPEQRARGASWLVSEALERAFPCR